MNYLFLDKAFHVAILKVLIKKKAQKKRERKKSSFEFLYDDFMV